MAKLPGGPPEYHQTLAGLMKLRDEGSFPLEAQDLYEKLRTRALADVKAARKARPVVTAALADLPKDVSLGGWIKHKWTSADEAVRNALQAVANAVGVSIPLSRTRTRPVGAMDSIPTRRTESTVQPNHGNSAPLESASEKEPEDLYDGPQWSDDDAPEWTACSSLHEAFRSDRDWY